MGILIQVKVRIRRGVENLARAPKDSLGAAGGPHYDPPRHADKMGRGRPVTTSRGLSLASRQLLLVQSGKRGHGGAA
jgi:hypothetical protein